MARLIILGNGYDISRLGNKTSYNKFGEWLCSRYGLNQSLLNKLPFTQNLNSYTGDFYKNAICGFPSALASEIDDARKQFFATMLVNMIQELNGNNWSDFENDLGKLPWEKYINEADDFFGNLMLPRSAVSYGTDFITSSAGTITCLFSEWIRQVDCGPVQKRKFENDLGEICPNDTILIFNYTNTFEQLFGLLQTDSKVCHIHGSVNNADSIVVGHGNLSKSDSTPLDCVKDYIHEAEAALFKRTEAIMNNTQSTWQKISNDFSTIENNEIYVFGWRGSGADEPYLKKIIEIIKSTNHPCSLFLSNHSNDGKEKEILWKRNEFLGNITLFDAG